MTGGLNDFSWALYVLKTGAPVARSSWQAQSVRFIYTGPDSEELDLYRIPATGSPTPETWGPSTEDLLAHDWRGFK